MGSGISVPKPRAGIAPDPLLRAILVKRRLSLSPMVSLPGYFPGTQPPIERTPVADAPAPAVRSGPSILRRLCTEPAIRDHFLPRIESDGVGALRIEIAVNRIFPAAEGEVPHRCRHADIDAEHPGLDALAEDPGRRPGLREKAGGVAVSAAVRQRDRRVQVRGAHQAHHRAKDLLPADEHLRRHIVEDRRPDEATPRPVGYGLGTAVEAKPGSFRHPSLDRSPNPLFLSRVHHGTERRGVVQAVSQLEFTRGADESVDDGVLSRSI